MPYQLKPIKPSEIEAKSGGRIHLVYGWGGAGKTSFAIASEDVAKKLFYANFDVRDSSHLLQKYKGEAVYMDQFRATTKEGALAMVGRFQEILRAAIQQGEGVFVVDNFANMWDLVKLAYLPANPNGKSMPKEFAEANNVLRGVFSDIEASKLVGVFTCPASELWVGAQQKTDYIIPDAWGHLEFYIATISYLFAAAEPRGVLHPAGGAPVEGPLHGAYKLIIWKNKIKLVSQGIIID